MKARLISDQQCAPRAHGAEGAELRDDGKWWWPAGTVMSEHDAYRLVQMGVAEPVDDECTLRACMTSAEMKTAQRHQEMVAKGIHPEDYQDYLDGIISGYDEDGEPIPGPNWIEPEYDGPLTLPEGYGD